MWTSGITRDLNGLKLQSQDANGQSTAIDITGLRSSLGLCEKNSAKIEINLNDGEHFCTQEYLHAIGRSDWMAGGQTCYRFKSRKTTVVIPAQLLIVALVAPTTLARAPLLSPQGPQALMTALCDPDTNAVECLLTPSRRRKFQAERWVAVARLEWVLQFPSARVAWSSVYASAIQGCLNIKLPHVCGAFKVRGIVVDGVLFATAVDCLKLTALEEPFEFAQGSVKNGKTWLLVEPYAKDSSIGLLAPLSDEAYNKLQMQLPQLRKFFIRRFEKLSARERIEILRRHLDGLPAFMSEMPVGCGFKLHQWIDSLKNRGVWSDVEAKLLETI